MSHESHDRPGADWLDRGDWRAADAAALRAHLDAASLLRHPNTVPRFVTLSGHSKGPCVLDRERSRIALVSDTDAATDLADWLNTGGVADDYAWQDIR